MRFGLILGVLVLVGVCACQGADAECGQGECAEDSAWTVSDRWNLEGDPSMTGGGSDVEEEVPEDPFMETTRELCDRGAACDYCVELSLDELDFGVVPLEEERIMRIEVRNCSIAGKSLYINDFGLERGQAPFALSAWSIGGAPYELSAGGVVFIEVVYDNQGELGKFQDHLELEFSGIKQEDLGRVSMPVRAESSSEPVANTCPVASAVGIPEGSDAMVQKSFDELPPGRLLLDGGLSYDRDLDDFVVSYRWSVESEPFGAGIEIEDPAQESTAVDLRLPGFYLLRLHVFDRWGRQSCRGSDVRINVVE